MSGEAALRDLEAIVGSDIASFDAGGAALSLAMSQRVQAFLDAHNAKVAAHVAMLAAQGASAPVSEVLGRQPHVSAAEARRRERRAAALAKTEAFGEALAAGAVGAEHADVLANATSRLDEQTAKELFGRDAELAKAAWRTSPEQFGRHVRNLIAGIERDHGVERAEQQRRDTYLSRSIDGDGMYRLKGAFHPELGARIWKALDTEIGALVAAGGDRCVDRTQLAAQALGNLVAVGQQAVRPTEADIVVIVDHQTVVSGWHHHTICETDHGAELTAEAVRRLACNGHLHPVISVDGVVINAGRSTRLANRTQRRALRAMYRTCAIPGCDVQFTNCEIHHIHEWELGGPTDLANLLPLCSRHHHLVHELGWTLQLDERRTLTIREPTGTIVATAPLAIRIGPTRDRPPRRAHRERRTPDETAQPLTT